MRLFVLLLYAIDGLDDDRQPSCSNRPIELICVCQLSLFQVVKVHRWHTGATPRKTVTYITRSSCVLIISSSTFESVGLDCSLLGAIGLHYAQ